MTHESLKAKRMKTPHNWSSTRKSANASYTSRATPLARPPQFPPAPPLQPPARPAAPPLRKRGKFYLLRDMA